MTRAFRVDAPVDDEFPADYADCFRLPVTGAARSASEWARKSLAGADVLRGVFATLVWHGALGFDLAPRRTAASLVGWQIVHDEPSELVVETDGSRMAGRMRFTVDDTGVAWTTMLRFHGTAGRRIWAVAGPVHRMLAPRCLGVTGRTLRVGGGAPTAG